MKKTKLCRYCNEQIPIDSEKCPYCGEEVIEQENNISDDRNLDLSGNNISNTKTSKYIIAVLFTVVLLMGSCAAFCFIKKDALKQIFLNQTYLEQGIALYNKSDYENAKVYFNKQINKSGDAEAYYYLGKIYEKENNEYATIYNYSNALRMNPKFDDIKIPFMELCIKSENTECINEFIKIVYEYDKNNISIAETYTKKLLEDSNNDTAAKILEEIVKKDSTNNFANYQLAKYYYEQHAIDKAYAHAVKVKIQDSEMAKVVANILIEKDYYSKAIDVLNNAINKYPEAQELYDLHSLAVQNHKKEAISADSIISLKKALSMINQAITMDYALTRRKISDFESKKDFLDMLDNRMAVTEQSSDYVKVQDEITYYVNWHGNCSDMEICADVIISVRSDATKLAKNYKEANALANSWKEGSDFYKFYAYGDRVKPNNELQKFLLQGK